MEPVSNKVEDFFNNKNTYLSGNPIIALRTDIVRFCIGEIKDKNILDIGCGNGELTLGYLKDNTITFLDLSSEMLLEVQKNIPPDHKENARFVKGDFLKTDFPPLTIF